MLVTFVFKRCISSEKLPVEIEVVAVTMPKSIKSVASSASSTNLVKVRFPSARFLNDPCFVFPEVVRLHCEGFRPDNTPIWKPAPANSITAALQKSLQQRALEVSLCDTSFADVHKRPPPPRFTHRFYDAKKSVKKSPAKDSASSMVAKVRNVVGGKQVTGDAIAKAWVASITPPPVELGQKRKAPSIAGSYVGKCCNLFYHILLYFYVCLFWVKVLYVLNIFIFYFYFGINKI